MLFELLIKVLQPALVCDVGSLDASEAQHFRKILPSARIIAFEANPLNFRLMQENEKLIKDRIEIQHKAVCNRDGIVSFNVEHLSSKNDSHKECWRKEISSTRKRVDGSLGVIEVKVESVRLDTFIQRLDSIPESVALWIDAEGAAFEVLECIEQIRDSVQVIHVEVETQEMWRGQKLKSDVEDLLNRLGFIILAGRQFTDFQQDLVFLNERVFVKSPFKFNALIIFARMLTYLQQLRGSIRLRCWYLYRVWWKRTR